MRKLQTMFFGWFFAKKRARQEALNLKAREAVKAEAKRLLSQYRLFLESDFSYWDASKHIDKDSLNIPIAHKTSCVYLERDLARDTINLFKRYKENDEYIKVLEQLKK